jgi:hypothetical protein
VNYKPSDNLQIRNKFDGIISSVLKEGDIDYQVNYHLEETKGAG